MSELIYHLCDYSECEERVLAKFHKREKWTAWNWLRDEREYHFCPDHHPLGEDPREKPEGYATEVSQYMVAKCDFEDCSGSIRHHIRGPREDLEALFGEWLEKEASWRIVRWVLDEGEGKTTIYCPDHDTEAVIGSVGGEEE
jgi:hypothetical protein